MLHEFLHYLVYGMPGWVCMTIALITYLESQDENDDDERADKSGD